MQVDEDAEAELLRPYHCLDEVRILRSRELSARTTTNSTTDLPGDVRLVVEHVDRPVADRDADAVQPCVLDVRKVLAGVERAASSSVHEYNDQSTTESTSSAPAGRSCSCSCPAGCTMSTRPPRSCHHKEMV
jgi:hypothetical protein